MSLQEKLKLMHTDYLEKILELKNDNIAIKSRLSKIEDKLDVQVGLDKKNQRNASATEDSPVDEDKDDKQIHADQNPGF